VTGLFFRLLPSHAVFCSLVLQDFFGGKHVVLLGGSWATVDSIAGRPSFRNFYQKGQQHVFAKFRLCRS
jgi:formylglycine-generating enzyme required for sulfatase activity